MKKILVLIAFLFSTFGVTSNVSAECTFDKDGTGKDIDIIEALGDCATGTSAVNLGKDKNLKAEEGFKDMVGQITRNLMYIFGVIAVGAIAYGGLTLTISTGNDEKVKKGKDLIKWASLGFLVIVSAGGIITIVVNVIYGLAGGN